MGKVLRPQPVKAGPFLVLRNRGEPRSACRRKKAPQLSGAEREAIAQGGEERRWKVSSYCGNDSQDRRFMQAGHTVGSILRPPLTCQPERLLFLCVEYVAPPFSKPSSHMRPTTFSVYKVHECPCAGLQNSWRLTRVCRHRR